MQILLLIVAVIILIGLYCALKDFIAAIVATVSIALTIVFLSYIITNGSFDYKDASFDNLKEVVKERVENSKINDIIEIKNAIQDAE